MARVFFIVARDHPELLTTLPVRRPLLYYRRRHAPLASRRSLYSRLPLRASPLLRTGWWSSGRFRLDDLYVRGRLGPASGDRGRSSWIAARSTAPPEVVRVAYPLAV